MRTARGNASSLQIRVGGVSINGMENYATRARTRTENAGRFVPSFCLKLLLAGLLLLCFLWGYLV
jgi:hypothetical protein